MGRLVGGAGRSALVAQVVVALVALGGGPGAADAVGRPNVDLLTDANVRIDGAAANEGAGVSVAAAGDVNGDGRDDVLVGAELVSNNGRLFSGSAYVVYGAASPVEVDLAALGARGFRIDGAAASDRAGWSVAAAGDVNGDGRDDVLVGAPFASNNGRESSGSAYVVYGEQAADPADVDLASLGGRGFRIDGAPGDATGGDHAGGSVAAAGDVNGDGRDDVLVGADSDGNNGPSSGSAYVVYGTANPVNVDLASLGDRGFRIDGAAGGDRAGWSVAGVGDVNGDGRDDVVVGALNADNNGRMDSGSAYVVYGNAAPSCSAVGPVSTPAGTPVELQLSCSDPEDGALTLSASAPPHGSLGPIGADQRVTYTPADGFVGSDAFTYTASDGTDTSAPATVSLTVTPPPPPETLTPPPSGTPARPARVRILGLRRIGGKCVHAPHGGRALRLRLAVRLSRRAALRVRIERAVRAPVLRRCPERGGAYSGGFRAVEQVEIGASAAAAAVSRPLTLRARLSPGLYRITVLARDASGLSRPARRFVRVLPR
jgi:hypothetical protein